MIKIRSTLLFILILSISVNLYLVSTKAENFIQGKYIRNEQYPASFNYLFIDLDKVFFGYMPAVYNENEAKETLYGIIDDLDLIRHVVGNEFVKKVSIYIVSNTVEDVPTTAEQSVFCEKSDIESGEHKKALIQASLCLKEPWIINGVYAYVFEKQTDDSLLADYYNSIGDMKITDLFAARFSSQWATYDDISIAKSTAASFVRYLISTQGFYALYKDDYSFDKQQWLNKIGVNLKFGKELLPYNYSYSYTKEYPLIINTENASFYFAYKPNMLKTPEDIENLLAKNIEGRQYILSYLEKDAPTCYNKIYQNSLTHINYKIVDKIVSSLGGLSKISQKQIDLANIRFHLHETMHFWIQNELDESKSRWKYEGMCDYLSEIVYTNNYTRELIFEILKNEELVSDWGVGKAYYLSNGGEMDDISKFDMRLYIDGLAYYSIKNPLKPESIPWISKPISKTQRWNSYKEGDELTYAQSCSFIAYLVDKYSLDQVIDYCMNGKDFYLSFGLGFNNSTGNWIEFLANRKDGEMR